MIIILSIIESIHYDMQFIHNNLANCVVGVMDFQSRGLNFITTHILSLRQIAKKEELKSQLCYFSIPKHSLYTHTWL